MSTGQPDRYIASVIAFGDRSTINDGLTRYLAAPGGTNMASELAVVVPRSGVLRNLHWSCELSGLTGSNNKITVHINGSPAIDPVTMNPLEATWNGAALSGSNTTEAVPVTAGDRVGVYLQLAPGGTNIRRPRASVELEMDSSRDSSSPWVHNGSDLYYDGGNVGIGIDTPGEKLAVDGFVEADGIKFPDGSTMSSAPAGGGGGVFTLQGGATATPPNAVLVDEGGNVGIGTGTISPQEKLVLSSGSNFATEMIVPVNVSVAPANKSGGNLSDGTYYFRIVAEDGVGTTRGSLEVSCDIENPPKNCCALSWDAVPGAVRYRIYKKGDLPGEQYDKYHTSLTNSYDYKTDSGAASAPEGVPEVTTAYANKFSADSPSWILNGNVVVRYMRKHLDQLDAAGNRVVDAHDG